MGTQFDNAERNPGAGAECVWMLAGVVDYKLCDRGFDCESCPLDLALRDAAHPHRPPAQRPAFDSADAPSRDYELAPLLFYHPAHVWARIEDEGVVRVGLDDFGQSLIGRVYAVDLPAESALVDAGGASWRVAHQAGETGLVSPVSGTIRQINTRLAAHPSLINRDPYGDGWAFVLQPVRLEECLRQLYYGRRVELWTGNEVRRLHQAVTEALSAGSVGPTMQDGGSRIKDFTSLLTADQMRQVINSFLSVPVSGHRAPGIAEGKGR